MSFFKTADLKIKEVITNEIQLSDFNNRKAKALNTIDAGKVESTRHVTAIEPNACYVVTVGLHGDIPNENGDYFEWEELLKKKPSGKFAGKYMFETWVGCPALTNHNPNNVVGEIIDAYPNREEKCIEFLIRVDEKKNSNLVKGLRNKNIKGTSMGVMVNHSYCNICNHRAENEDQWCIHLSPRKLNIKGKKYTGQDGNKYPEKLGMLCYEINRDLEGVEDSFITLGEPADPDALVKTVLATKSEGNTEMPKDVIKGQADVRAMEIQNGGGMHIGAPTRYAGKSDETGRTYSSKTQTKEAQLQDSIRMHLAQLGGKVATMVSDIPEYTNPQDVVTAIKNGSLPKANAIDYVRKFDLISAEKADDLSANDAVKVLQNSIDNEKIFDDEVRKAELACPPDPKNSTLADEAAKGSGPEDNPSPKGNMNAKDQMPGSKTSDLAVSEKEAKTENNPKADGLKEPNNQMPNTQTSDLAKETNEKAKTEAQKMKLDNDSVIDSPVSQLALTLNEVKPEEGQPSPKGNMNAKNQLEGSETSTLSVKPGEAPTEKGQPKPQGNMNAKNQLEGSETSKLADQVNNNSKPQEKKPAPVTAQAENPSPEPKKEEKSEKSDKPEHKPSESKEPKSEGSDKPEHKPFGGEKKEEGFGGKGHPLSKLVDQLSGNIDIINRIRKELEKLEHDVDALADAAQAPASPDSPVMPTDSPDMGDPLAAIAYKVDYINDEESPLDSYYVVKNKDQALFSFTCKAIYDEKPEEKLEGFKSAAYKEALLKELNAKGAKAVYEQHYNPRGIVIAQAMPDSPAPSAKVPPEPQAGPANVDPNSAAGLDMSNNNAQGTVTLDKVATALASIIPNTDSIANGLSEVKSMLSDDSNMGAMAAKIKHILADSVNPNSEVPKAPTGDMGIPAGSPTPNPASGPSSTPKAVGAMVQVPVELITKANNEILSLRKEVAEKNEKLAKIDTDNKIKARVSATYNLAKKKAELGLIDSKSIEAESVRLAKLSDDNLKSEVKILEESIKVAKTLVKNVDYNNTSLSVTASTTKDNINTVIPNQADPIVEKNVDFGWSRKPRSKYS